MNPSILASLEPLWPVAELSSASRFRSWAGRPHPLPRSDVGGRSRETHAPCSGEDGAGVAISLARCVQQASIAALSSSVAARSR